VNMIRNPLMALLALLLVACAGSGQRPEPQRLLLSYDGPVAAASSSPRPRLVVRGVELPDYLDRRELVRRAGPAGIVRDDTAFWAERPGKAITRWVTLALGAARADFAVEAYTPADGRAPDAVLALSLERFEPDAENVVRLRGRWVYAPNGRKATLSGRFDADAPSTGNTAESQVLALNAALAQAVKALATELPAPP